MERDEEKLVRIAQENRATWKRYEILSLKDKQNMYDNLRRKINLLKGREEELKRRLLILEQFPEIPEHSIRGDEQAIGLLSYLVETTGKYYVKLSSNGAQDFENFEDYVLRLQKAGLVEFTSDIGNLEHLTIVVTDKGRQMIQDALDQNGR